METITVDLGDRSYPVYIGCDVLRDIGRCLAEKEVCILTDSVVKGLYEDLVRDALESAGGKVHSIVVPNGERSKDISRLLEVYDALLEFGANRKTPLVALGGGVVGDLGGFSAATFMRGIPYIQVPTTLLAQVDSSVGGKTAVNHPKGKNVIGAFYQPEFVLIDINTLSSLPDEEFLSGLAEVIKYGIVLDKGLFEVLEGKREAILKKDPDILMRIIRWSVQTKADVVKKDEREEGLRTVLNFGHSVGHAVENLLGYGAVRHGQAVAKGMGFSVRLSKTMGLISAAESGRIIELLRAYGFDLSLPAFSRREYETALAVDKKAVGREINFVLTGGIGRFILKKLALLDILDFIEQ
jgi:3-dehydroquinate synthase